MDIDNLEKTGEEYPVQIIKMVEKKPAFPPIIVLAIGILAVSTASLLIRFAQQTTSSLVIATARMTIAAMALAPVALLKHRHEYGLLRPRQRGLIFLAGVFLAFHFASWITSLEYTTVASSVVLVTTAPLWVALFSPLILHEKLSKNMLLGLGIALTGSVIVSLSSNCQITNSGFTCSGFTSFFHGRAFLGNLLALAGAFLSAGYLMIGRMSRGNLSLTPYTFGVYGTASLVLILLTVLTHQNVKGLPPQTYIWLIALAVIPQLIGHTSFNWALKYLSAAYVSIALLGEPVGTVILAYLFLRESPSVVEILGGVMILTGIFLSSQTRKPLPIMETGD